MKLPACYPVFLVLICLVLVFPHVCAEEAILLNFEDGANPGFSRFGTCSVAVASPAEAGGGSCLALTGRSGPEPAGAELRAAKLGVSLGDSVSVSFRALQLSGAAGHAELRLADPESTLLASAPLPSGEWTEVSASFVYDSRSAFRFTTDSAIAGADLYLDDIRCEVLSSGKPLAAADWGKWPADLPSLKDTYAEHFLFGSALAGTEFSDIGRLKFCADQYAILTPGNELKPDSVLDRAASQALVRETGDETRVAVGFKAVKPFLDYCQSAGIRVHGHTLLWHNQTPEAFFHLGYDMSKPLADREIMLGRMENYIRAVLDATESAWPGLIMSWDVLNEAINDADGNLRDDVMWYRTVGPDYPRHAFAFARKYARKDIILCYNDYSIPNTTKLKGVMKLLIPLIQDGTVDCCGFQAHYQTDWPSVAQVEAAMKQIIALGLKIRVSEMDIKVSAPTEQLFHTQALIYKNLMDLFVRYDQDILAVQTWGVTDDCSWLAPQYPLLFSANGQPKPAFRLLVGME